MGSLAGILILVLIAGFVVLRSDPVLLAKLPPFLRTAISSVNLATGVPAPPPAGTVQFGARTKSSGCRVANSLPDRGCTPGAIFPNVTAAQICVPGYAGSVRDVPQSLKDEVYATYGILSHSPGQYEVDHLISLELGGSNDISNLWPEATEPLPGANEKDRIENYLHDQVCSGRISLQQAQQEIATNWVAVYERIPR